MTDEVPEEVEPIESKAGRNKGRDLVAGALNNVATTLFLAASLQPVVAIVQQQRPLRLAEGIASAIFLVLTAVFAVAAQRVAKRMED